MREKQLVITAQDAMIHADYASEQCLAWAKYFHQELFKLYEKLEAMQDQIDEHEQLLRPVK